MNEYLLDYIGKTGTKNVLDDITNFVLENKIKKLGYTPRPNVVSIVHTEKNKEILLSRLIRSPSQKKIAGGS